MKKHYFHHFDTVRLNFSIPMIGLFFVKSDMDVLLLECVTGQITQNRLL